MLSTLETFQQSNLWLKLALETNPNDMSMTWDTSQQLMTLPYGDKQWWISQVIGDDSWKLNSRWDRNTRWCAGNITTARIRQQRGLRKINSSR
jgi:hypothetical protein